MSQRSILHFLSDGASAALIHGLFHGVGLLGLKGASAFGGWMGRRLPLFARKKHRQMLARIQRAFPDRPAPWVEQVARQSWSNLGRTLGEYTHLHHLEDLCEMEGGLARVPELQFNRPLMFVSAHLGNWEAQTAIAKVGGVPFTAVGREPNIKAAATILRRARGSNVVGQIEKRDDAALAQLRVLRQGGRIGTMFDVRYAEDLLYLFFGRPVQVPTAIARLSLATRSPLYPARTERLEGGRLRLSLYPAIPDPATGDRRRDAAIVTQVLMRLLESWVRQRPGDYLWLHDLWGDTKRGKRGGQLAQLVFPDLEKYIRDLGYDEIVATDPIVGAIPRAPVPLDIDPVAAMAAYEQPHRQTS